MRGNESIHLWARSCPLHSRGIDDHDYVWHGLELELSRDVYATHYGQNFSVRPLTQIKELDVKIHVEIYLASRLLSRSGDGTFSLQELVQRVRSEFGDERHGVVTQAGGYCVANSPANAPTVRNYLWRLDQGRYRCFDARGDVPHPSRSHSPVQPIPEEVPQDYRDLLPPGDQSCDAQIPVLEPQDVMTPEHFQRLARGVMSQRMGGDLSPGSLPHIPKRWDMLSVTGRTVGDAKYYTLVHSKGLAAAKFSTIAEHVWLLEKTGAATAFLVFGNDRRVPEQWLERYGHLVGGVRFYFLSDEGELEPLN